METNKFIDVTTYGYEDGLLSNSMLQAAIVCPVKYDLMYRKGIRPDKNGIYWDEAFIGNVLHKVIELHDGDHDACNVAFWSILEGYFGPSLILKTRKLMLQYQAAREATIADKARWGQVCKAPEMTSFWKKNYAGLDSLLGELNIEAEAKIEGSVFNKSWLDIIKHGLIGLDNWRRMRIDAPIASELVLSGEVGPTDARVRMVGTCDRIEPRPEGGIALCDFKSGKWPYDASKTANSDQLGLYHRLLELTEYGAPVEWCIYNLFTGETVRIRPNDKILEKFDNRLATNLRYFKQLEAMFDKVEVPTPAGSSFKTGCPCILAKTGDCHYIFDVKELEA